MLDHLIEIILSISQNPYLISLFAGLLFGETVILAISILAAGGLFPIWIVLVFSYLGELISDFFYFWIGRSAIIHRLNKIEKFSKEFHKTNNVIDKMSHKNIFVTLFYSKFVYGVRTLTTIFLGYKKIKWKNFIIAEIIVMFFAVSLVVIVGVLIGNGYKIALGIFKSFKIALTLVFVSLFIFYLVQKNLVKYISKKQEILKK